MMAPRISSTTPVILCARSVEILLAMEEDTAEQINVTTVQIIIGIMYPVTSPKAKWDKDAGSHRHFQLIAKNHIEDKKHHEAAAKADKSAVQSDVSARKQRKYLTPLPFPQEAAPAVAAARLQYEFRPHEEGHDHRKQPHLGVRHILGEIAADDDHDQNSRQHESAVFQIHIAVFFVGSRRNGGGRHVCHQSDAHSLVPRAAKKCNEHGR